jgi:transcriptional regulator GlxA family with amidase domain
VRLASFFPITLADIARVARTSARAVQRAFARSYNTTPTAYLRRVRLERVHRDLRAGDPIHGDTVAGIATR